MMPETILALGWTLNRRRHHIGAAVGSAMHMGAFVALSEKMKGEEPEPAHAVDAAVGELDRIIANPEGDGIAWDQITNTVNDAQKQTIRMTLSLVNRVIPNMEPVAVEERLEAQVTPRLILSGRKDVSVREPKRIADFKSGRRRRQYKAQYGGYSLLDRSHGRTVDEVAEAFAPRVPMKKPQPEPTLVSMPAAEAERVALNTLDEIDESIGHFVDRVDKGGQRPEQAFRANPSSMLCGRNFCPAWGSSWCREHLDE